MLGELREQGVALGGGQAQLQHLRPGHLRDEVVGPPLPQDAPAVHDHQPVAEVRRLLHVVRGQQHGDAARLEQPQLLPDEVAGLRVQPRGGFVEDEHARVVHQRPRDREAALHAAGEVVHVRVRAVVQLEQFERLVDALAHLLAVQPEVAGVDLEVLAHEQVGVEVVVLGHDAQHGLHLARGFGHAHARHAQLAARHRRSRRDHADGGGLARAVGAEHAEALPLVDGEVDAVHGDEIAVVLDEAARLDEGGCHVGVPFGRPRAAGPCAGTVGGETGGGSRRARLHRGKRRRYIQSRAAVRTESSVPPRRGRVVETKPLAGSRTQAT